MVDLDNMTTNIEDNRYYMQFYGLPRCTYV